MKVKKLSKAGKKALNDCGYEDTWVGTQYKLTLRQFEEKSKELTYVIQFGGGIENLHMMDLLKDLQWLYLKAASLKMAANEIKVDITD